jgi:putative transposase
LTIEGVRFEVPSELRHVERLAVRYARWDLTTADVIDERTGAIVATLYPLDKAANADGRRRILDRVAPPPGPQKPAGMAPLLRKLVHDYWATGLPPAYLPKDDLGVPSEGVSP